MYQQHERLDVASKCMSIRLILSTVCLCVCSIIFKDLLISSIITCVFSTFIFVYLLKITYSIFSLPKIQFDFFNAKRILKDCFPIFAGSFLSFYILNAPKYAIDSFLAENYQTIFGIIVMPATVIGLVAQFLIHPYLNKIVELYKNRDLKNLNKLILKLIFMIVAFGIISSLLAYFLGPEVLGLVYGIDLKVYRIGLLIIIISATLYTIGVIYSSVLTAVRETFSQFIAYIIISLFAIVCSNILTKQKEMNGAVIAYFAIMALQFIIYTTYTNIKLRKIFNKEEENE